MGKQLTTPSSDCGCFCRNALLIIYCVKCFPRPTTQARITSTMCYKLSTLHLSVDALQMTNEQQQIQHISHRYRLSYVRSSFFSTPPSSGRLFCEAGMNVPTFSQFRILLRLRRQHEASNRPPGRPSPGEVEAGGYGSGRSKGTCSLRVEKGPPGAESARISTPMIKRFCIPYIYKVPLRDVSDVKSRG